MLIPSKVCSATNHVGKGIYLVSVQSISRYIGRFSYSLDITSKSTCTPLEGSMAITFEAIFDCKRDKITLTEILPDGSRDKRTVDLKEISKVGELSQNLDWTRSENTSQKIGETLFDILNAQMFLY